MKTIKFKIISNENKKIYQEGYVEVPEAVEEIPEWFYYDQNGFAIPRVFTHHDEIGITQIGATDEQEADIEEFNRIIMDEIDFINDAILNAEEDENRTYIRNDITIIVNDGFDVELVCIKKIGDDWGGNNLLFRYNIKKLPLDSDEDINEKLYYINKRCDFEWRHYESYDNMDYNGHFFEAVYIDKDNQMHKMNGEKVIITDEFICELMESDCVAAVQELLGIY